MAYSYTNPYQQMNFNTYPQYQPVQQPNVQNVAPTPLQTQVVVRVPSYEAVKTFYVEAGKPVTFFDDNSPFCYVKTAGTSPVDPPKIRIFELIERSETDTQNSAKNSDFSNVSEKSIDIAECVQKREFDELRQEFEQIIKSVDKLRFDVDAMSEKSSKRMVQKARKDADDE